MRVYSAALITFLAFGRATSLAPSYPPSATRSNRPCFGATSQKSQAQTRPLLSVLVDRRTLLRTVVAAALAGIGTSTTLSSPPAALAAAAGIPMVTTDEFLSILRDSARSIQEVEFTGPKSETVTVRLVDGTAFGIKDVVESSTDPRSPLRIAAFCRENQVRTRFLTIEQVLASAPKRKKMYTNERVLEANAREKERLARMEQDEQERLAELFRMQEEEAKRGKN